MKRFLIGTLFAAASLSMTACASNAPKEPTSYADYIEAAQSLHAEAKKNKNVWKQKKMKKPYVEHYIAKAEEAKKKGDEAKALKYAKEAHKSAEAQMRQVNSWKTLTPPWEKKK
jgi:flagellar basal body L-ring protein FlgH